MKDRNGNVVGRGASSLWLSQGWLHSDASCPLLEDDRREVADATRGERCACLVSDEFDASGDPRRDRARALARLRASNEDGSTTWWNVVEAMATGLESREPAVRQARRVALGNDDGDARARAAVGRALKGSKRGRGDALNNAVHALERATQRVLGGEGGAEVSESALNQWVSTWVETGSGVAATRAMLNDPGSLRGRDEEAALRSRARWEAYGEVLESAAYAMLGLLERRPRHVVLVHEWRELLEEGSSATWAALGQGDYVIENGDLAVVVPEHLAQWMDEHHHRGSTLVKKRRAVDLGPAGTRWESTLETMKVLWKEAGGSFRFQIDVYGEEERPVGLADAREAYQAARALEEG